MNKDTFIPHISVKAYQLEETNIIVTASDGKHTCDISVDRSEFEGWLTDGTGIVEMNIHFSEGSIIKEIPIKEPIADYWLQGQELDNSPVLEHIKAFITRNELQRSLTRMEIAKQHLLSLCEQFDEAKKEDAFTCIAEYGQLNQRAGELAAA